MEDILNQPPFPTIYWNDYWWEGQIYHDTRPFFTPPTVRGNFCSDGSVELNIITPADEQSLPSAEQIAAYRYLLKAKESIKNAILEAIFSAYPKWRKLYGCDEQESAERMPEIEHPEQLEELISLNTVRIFSASKNGVAYVGFQFNCLWDTEHGLGAMTHNGRVVELGGADTAILEWIAEDDAKAW